MTEPALTRYVDRYTDQRWRTGETLRQTALDQRLTLLQFATSFGQRRVETLGKANVLTWLESIRHLAPSTRRNKLSVVKGFCRWLAAEKVVKRDPTVGVKSPRQPRALPKVFAATEMATLMASLPDARARLVVLLMVQQGLRSGEVAGLELGDISETQLVVRRGAKGGHERALPLLSEVRAAMNVYFGERSMRAGPLVQNYQHPGRGLTSHTVSHLVRQWVKEAGVKKGPHDGRSAHGLRRTAATDMFDAGADIMDVAEALGHANLASVRHYAKYRTAKLAAAMGGRSYGSGGAETAS